MPDPVDALVLDLLEWIGSQPRPYAEVIDAWRTSCPRLPVWEEANARGYLTHGRTAGGASVAVSAAGLALLLEKRGGGIAAHTRSESGNRVHARPLR